MSGDKRMAGRRVLVTGASTGLGLACAIRLGQAGARVAICGRDGAKLETAQATLLDAGTPEVLALQADLADAAAVNQLVPQTVAGLGGLDGLVLNSGHIAYGGLEDLEDADWQAACDLLLMSAVRLSRAAIAPIAAAGGGDIVFLTSATLQQASSHLILSSVFRTGVAALAKSLSHAVANRGIRVNTVAPGYFDTGRVRARIDAMVTEQAISRDEAGQVIAGGVPMGRVGEAAELAELVAFVMEGRAPFLNGATIAIDGGAGRTIF